MKKTLTKKHLKHIVLFCCDILIFTFAWNIAVLISGYNLGASLLENYGWLLGGIGLVLIVNGLFKLYTAIWEYAGLKEVLKIICSVCIVAGYLLISHFITKGKNNDLSLSFAFISTSIYMAGIFVSRFLVKVYTFMKTDTSSGKSQKRLMIVGAGAGGVMLVNEIRKNRLDFNPVCFIDDDVTKVGDSVGNVKVVGTTLDIVEMVEKYRIDEIIIAMPKASKKDIKRIVEECQKTNCKTKIVPGIYQLASGEVTIAKTQDISINDLLGREPIKVNLDEILGYIEGQTVLVTGGGGSIGSELCRQIARHNPKRLIILDIYENNAYEIQQELKRNLPEVNVLTLIASVRDSKKMNDVFKKYKPDIVFHAAAHKHVPLMETSPNEAVKNNVSGTFKVADAAGRNNVKKFILISTDKAVNPTNVMGATKRVCEMIIQAMNSRYSTDYVAVRFGNVLGSNGSVIPLFKKQIAEGGPVTVTHKDIVRYFMTIPEAVSLVLQAGAYAHGGEIFVLDMGEPVKIYDLAIQVIKLSGLEPFKDIDIKITGLRPGEKLYEERLMDAEGLERTPNKMISIGKPIEFDNDKLFETIDKLYMEAYNETDKMKDYLHELVPTYVIDRTFEE